MLPSIFFCQVIFLYDRLGFLFSFHANFPHILGLIFCKCIEAMKFAFLQHFLKMIFTVKLSNNMESLSQLILGRSYKISGRSNVIFTQNIKLFGRFQAKFVFQTILNDFIAFKLRNTKDVSFFFKIFLAKIRIDLFRSKQKHFEYRIPSYKDTQNFFSRKILTFLTSIMEPKILCLKSASRNLLANQLPK